MLDIEGNKEEFLRIARENVKRDGLEELLKFLESTDFFTAPCSTKFHLAEKGGLCPDADHGDGRGQVRFPVLQEVRDVHGIETTV